MRNIGLVFVRMGQYADAITSLEHIMDEKADFTTGELCGGVRVCVCVCVCVCGRESVGVFACVHLYNHTGVICVCTVG